MLFLEQKQLMNLLKLGFYGMVLGLVFGSFVFVVAMQIPFQVALFLHQAGVSVAGIVASVVIVGLLMTASSVLLCVEVRNNFSFFIKEKLELQEDLYSLNENLAKACGLLAGLTLVLKVQFLCLM